MNGNIIFQSCHFKTVETINIILKCVIFLHNLFFEESFAVDMLENDEEAYVDDLDFRVCVTPIWAGLDRISVWTPMFATAGSIARLSNANEMIKEEKEDEITKMLLVRHFRDSYGKEKFALIVRAPKSRSLFLLPLQAWSECRRRISDLRVHLLNGVCVEFQQVGK